MPHLHLLPINYKYRKTKLSRRDVLNEEVLNLNLDLVDGALQLTRLVRRNACRYDSPTDPAGPTQRHLAGDENIRNVLVLTEEGEVKKNFQGLSVSGHDDDLGYSTIQCLRGLVGALLQLLVLSGLLDEILDCN
eukprot:CAMPEP_0118661968 /NCGR_PEP_ID=MMETSP0785-20121206/16570_1 /TAXON_ID=91992 /ORGANISM="Bolidomonas pacifica, Strain CCMP 1866" /LENGTH=133 /DNA_ID=CAMNT_0006555459 /DNA_START=218 /DNA_END=616 /DNA_ORIENTATION=-